MQQLWIERKNLECTEQWLYDQKNLIIDKNLNECEQQVGTRQEQHDQQPEEEQTPLDPDIPVETIPETVETTETTQIDPKDLINDNNDEYKELSNEYVDLLEKVKAQPLKARQKLPKVKNDNTRFI